MGGWGSGNFRRHKATVEDCRTIIAARWKREGILSPGSCQAGRWIWYEDESKRKEVASIAYESRIADDGAGAVRLSYTITPPGEAVDYRVAIQATCPPLGGSRPWFTCPLIVGGHPCGRRCGKLHRSHSSPYFGCRECLDLTYTSCRESHRFDSLWKDMGRKLGMNPRRVKKLVERDIDGEIRMTGGGYGLGDIIMEVLEGPPYPPGFIEGALEENGRLKLK